MEIPIIAYTLLVLIIPFFTTVLNNSLQSVCAYYYKIPLIQESTRHLLHMLATANTKEYKQSYRRILSFRAAIGFTLFSVGLSVIVSFIASLGVEVVQYQKLSPQTGNLADIVTPLTDTRAQVRSNLYEQFKKLNGQYHQQAYRTLSGNVSTLEFHPLRNTRKIDFIEDNPLPEYTPILKEKSSPEGIAFLRSLKGASAVNRNVFSRKILAGLNDTEEPGLYYIFDTINVPFISDAFRYEVVPTAYYKANAVIVFDSLAAILFDQLGTTVRKKEYDLDSVERYVYDELRCDSKSVRMFQEFRQTTSSLWEASPAFSSVTVLVSIIRGNKKPLIDKFVETYERAQRIIKSWGLKAPTSKAEDLSAYRRYDLKEITFGHAFFWEYFVGSPNSPTRTYVACEIGTRQKGISDFVQCTVDRISINERQMTAKEENICEKAVKKYGNTSERIIMENNDSLQAFPASELPLFSTRVELTPLRVYRTRLFTKVSQTPRVILLGKENFFKENMPIKNEHMIPAKAIADQSSEFAMEFSSDWPSSFMSNFTIYETKSRKLIDLAPSGLVLIVALVVVALSTAGLVYIYVPKEYRQSLYITIAEPWAIVFHSNEVRCAENPTETHKYIQLDLAAYDASTQSYLIEDTPNYRKVDGMHL